jgi:hypothetical protein
MKTIALFLFTVCACFAEVYRFPEHRFSLELPSRIAWSIDRSIDNDDPKMSLRVFTAKDVSSTVSLLVGDNGTGVSDLEEYARRWAVGTLGPGAKLVTKEATTLDGHSAIRYIIEISVQDHRMFLETYLAFYGRKLCVLGLIADNEVPSQDPILREVLNSAKISK